jgi:hypothetical protein
MKRVMQNADWTLFSPSDVGELHDKFGAEFEAAYLRFEDRAARGELKLYKKIPAVQLWRKMLSMLFETGHPWITFKDPCNLRSPQQHVGVVHSSNLCTEITLNTSSDEIAVCNLGSVNLVAHMTDRGLDFEKLKKTIRTAMRMLDNVIDINYYAVDKAKNSNMRPPPGGPGHHGVPGLPAPHARALREPGGGGVRRPLDGDGGVRDLLGLDRARRGARPLLLVRRVALAARHPAAGHPRSPRRRARRLRRARPLRGARLGGLARPHPAARHAQLQLHRDRPHRDHREHRRACRPRSSRPSRTCS